MGTVHLVVMKRSVLVFALFGCFLVVRAKEKNDVAKDKLRGPVRSVSVAGYKMAVVNGKPQKDKVIFTSSSKYNENGRILEFITSAIEDSLEGEAVKFKAVKSIYKYNDAGELTGKLDYNPDGSLEDSSFYKVDAKGSRVDWYTYKGNGTEESHTISEYTINGDIVELTEFVKGKLKGRTSYIYDNNGNQTDEISFDENGKIRWKEVMRYNDKGQLIEVTDYKEDDAVEAQFSYRYDTRGNLGEEGEYYNDTSTRNKRTTTKYDLDGNPIEINHFNYNGRLVNQIKVDNMGLHFTDITYRPDGVLKSVIAKKYDDKANLVFEDRFFTQDSVRVKYDYKFEYDKEGNWTKNTTSKNKVPIQTTERKFEYYVDPKPKKK